MKNFFPSSFVEPKADTLLLEFVFIRNKFIVVHISWYVHINVASLERMDIRFLIIVPLACQVAVAGTVLFLDFLNNKKGHFDDAHFCAFLHMCK